MPISVMSYSLLISCPSDVVQFFPLIQDAVSSFNRGFGSQNNIVIQTQHYLKDAYSNVSLGGTAQGEINKQLVSNADMLIGVFWTKFGQPTGEYGSGTEEEISRMMNNHKPVILYFLDKPIPPSKIDVEQLKKINEFKKRVEGNYEVLADESGLALRLHDELELRFKELLRVTNTEYSESSQEKTILWVDDRPENNAYGRDYFEDKGIEVILALSTEQALDYLENNRVSVIISDMGRREGPREGYVLLDRLRAKGNTTPFIIFAGSRSREHILETQHHGGQGCTNDFAELFSMVSEIMLGSIREQVFDY